MKKQSTVKRIGSMLLTLALMIAMIMPGLAMPAYAGTQGVIKVKYNPNVTGLEQTNFKLYHVADFDHDQDGKSYIKPDNWAQSVDLNAIPDEDKAGSEEAWTQNWLNAAYTLSKIEGKPDAVWEDALSNTDSFQSLGTFPTGVYLLVGDEQKVGDKIWWPVPVLIDVLQGERDFTLASQEVSLKMKSKYAVYKHTVYKTWDDDGHEAARPDSIRVGIYYGEELIDVATIGKDNDWMYTWYTTEDTSKTGETKTITYTSKDPEDSEAAGVETKILSDKNNYTSKLENKTASTWTATEMQELSDKENLKYYVRVESNTVSGDTSGTDADSTGSETTDTSSDNASESSDPFGLSETFALTNRFATAELEITKNLENYLSQADANATVVFEITGTIKGTSEDGTEKEETVYTNRVGMTFTGTGTQVLTLDNIPVNLTKLTVKEVYATNYKVSGDSEISISSPSIDENGKRHYTASFTNVYDENPPTYASGIVNKYDSDGTYKGSTDTSSMYTVATEQ